MRNIGDVNLAGYIQSLIPVSCLNANTSLELRWEVDSDGGRFNGDGTGFWNGFTEIGRLIATHVDEESS